MNIKRILSALASVSLLTIAPAMTYAHGTQIPLTIRNGAIVTHEWGIGGDTTIRSEQRLFTIPLSQRNEPTTATNQNGWYGTPPDDANPATTANSAFSHPGYAYGRSSFVTGQKLFTTFTQEAKVWDSATDAFVATGGEKIQGIRGGGFTAGFSTFQNSDNTRGGTGLDITMGNTADPDQHSNNRWRILGNDGLVSGTVDDGIYLALLSVSTDQSGVGASLPFALLFTKNVAANDPELLAAQRSLQAVGIPEPAALASIGLVAAGALLRRRLRA